MVSLKMSIFKICCREVIDDPWTDVNINFIHIRTNIVCSASERSLMTLRQLYIKRFSWQYRCYAQLSNGPFLSIAKAKKNTLRYRSRAPKT